MNELRWNPLAGQWVTIATERAARPSDFAARFLPVEAEPDRPCPFCPGHEGDFPPALESYARDGEWLVRVVPNKYPAFRGVEHLDLTVLGPVFTQAPASGIHELLIVPATHQGDVTRSDPPDVVGAGRAVRDGLRRVRALLGDVPYNLVLHTAPRGDDGPYHWHVHVVPRVTSVAGFEQGTGALINIVAPELAAQQLVRQDPGGA